MLKNSWNWIRKNALSPIKLSQLTIGIALVGQAASVKNPYFIIVPIGIVMVLGYIAMIQGVIESSKNGKPLGSFPFSW